MPEPKKFSDCARVHKNCEDAEKYNVHEDDDNEAATVAAPDAAADDANDETKATTTQPTDDENVDNATDKTPEKTDEDNDIDSTTVEHKRPMNRKYKLLQF